MLKAIRAGDIQVLIAISVRDEDDVSIGFGDWGIGRFGRYFGLRLGNRCLCRLVLACNANEAGTASATCAEYHGNKPEGIEDD